MLPRNDHVHVVTAAQTMVGHREQGIGVRRQVHADHLGLLVDDEVDKARILVRETVVVLAPTWEVEQVVE